MAATAVQRYANSRPAAPALSGHRFRLNYRQLAESLEQWRQLLGRLDAGTIALAADNSPEWVCADLAASETGLTVVPLPQFFSAEQKRHVLADSGAQLVLTDRAGIETLQINASPVATDLPVPGVSVIWRLADSDAARPGDAAKISYTSGTTGQPKGVCLSQRAMDTVAGSLVAATGELNLSRHLCLLPLATLLENVAGNYAPLIAGAEVVVPGLVEIGWTGGGLDVSRLCRLISTTKPDSIILVPEMLRALVDAIRGGWQAPASLRFVAVGGGHVAPALVEEAEGSGLPVFEGYGLTECASVVTLNTPNGRRRGSVGKPLPHADVRIDGGSEVCIAGPCVCGYLGDKGARSSHHVTGDIGHFDEDGFLYITGRRRNVFINSFGRNVSPDWIEPEFLCHPAIAQIAVFGEARPWNVALVVPRPEASASDVDRAIARTNAELPDYARVAAWIPAAEPFAIGNGLLTPNGRTRRAAVWKAYRDRIEARYGEAGRSGHDVLKEQHG